MPLSRFSDDFIWGLATDCYQVEGSPLTDGAGPSIWHTFADAPGKIERGETGDVSCDQYNRYREDIELMRNLGLGAYRFHIACPRVLPEGTGAVNEPWVFAWLGYGVGFHAPGRAEPGAALAAGHNVLRAHGECVGRFREIVPSGAIGTTLSVLSCMPDSDGDANRVASDRTAAFSNYWFSDPICSGSYPDARYEEFGDAVPAISEEERAIITGPIDFIGLNYYTRKVVPTTMTASWRAVRWPVRDRLQRWASRSTRRRCTRFCMSSRIDTACRST
ncbi:MAG: glycosyl hydrolase family protein [Myxococcales bacterium]|nr:MAG: glycosyl hydrolase family protein [Myxococcales bacterium]